LDYGIYYLNRIFEAYDYDKNNIELFFADYNSGLYSSRNAELQYELHKLNYGKEPSVSFTDGDFLIWESFGNPDSDKSNTQKVVEEYFEKQGYSTRMIRENLKLEKKEEFEGTDVYEKIKSDYGSGALKGRVPTSSTYSIKHGVERTASKYANEARAKYEVYCRIFQDELGKSC
jgi:hypothetical protein